MLKLRFKKEEKVRIQIGNEICDVIMGGYENGKYSLIFDAPLSIKITHGKALIKSKERLDENEQIRLRKV